jgi:hypothetical protein
MKPVAMTSEADMDDTIAQCWNDMHACLLDISGVSSVAYEPQAEQDGKAHETKQHLQ